MIYRTLGVDKLQVSCLTLGGNIFGYSCDEKETVGLIHAAHDYGINCIDTADVYGNGLSEELIGRAIQGIRKKWIIATKVGVKSGESVHGKGSQKNIVHCL